MILAAALVLPTMVAGQTLPVPRPSPEERAARAGAVPAPVVSQAQPAPVDVASRPLTEAEQADFARQVTGCWNLGGLPEGARLIPVTIGFEMGREAVPLPDSFTLIGSGDAGEASPDDIAAAMAAARRAVLRCAGQGYDIPPEAYAHWRRVEITFDPVEGVFR